MRKGHVHALKRGKIRQSWNKYNLFNLSRLTHRPINLNGTYFQQKWKAKSLTRAYHGEQIKERQWHQLFTSRLNSVVPMSAALLARSDGSSMAAGRGSGLSSRRPPDPIDETPYMQMLYAPMERRLDTAIFRALFASSARQARQFVVHGDVKVNGKKMIYPGYLLNPGDMFQVEPDRVLFATGAPKDKIDRHASRRLRKEMAKKAAAEKASATASPEQDQVSEPTSDDESASETSPDGDASPAHAPVPAPSDPKAEVDAKTQLKELLSSARAIIADSKEVLSAKRKQDLRSFQRLVKKSMSQAGSGRFGAAQLGDVESQLDEILGKIAAGSTARATSSSSGPSTSSSSSPSPSPSSSTSTSSSSSATASASVAGEEATEPKKRLSAADRRDLAAALEEARENPFDPSKPYATPWRPRDYMSVFAFIPRYLEVNQNVCSAVYVRHPVARPGAAEVPTPFAFGEHQLAFNWYLRRR